MDSDNTGEIIVQMTMPERVHLMDAPLDLPTLTEATDICLEFAKDRGAGHHVVTINAFGIMMMRDRPLVREAIQNASLIVPDGISMTLAARLFGVRVRGRVTGVAIANGVLERAASDGLRVYCFGSREEVIQALGLILQKKFPGLAVAGVRNGYFRAEDEAAIVAEIRNSRPDVLLVGLPNPMAEEWIYRHKASLGVGVIIGVGGTFDVMSGKLKRAPAWMQRLGIEWLWRFLLEPRKRWKIILYQLPRFVVMALCARVRLVFDRAQGRGGTE